MSIIIHMEMHPEGLSSNYCEAIVDEVRYDTSYQAGDKIVKYKESSLYKMIRKLLDAGYAGTPFSVVSEIGEVPVMSGILNPRCLPSSWLTPEERAELRE